MQGRGLANVYAHGFHIGKRHLPGSKSAHAQWFREDVSLKGLSGYRVRIRKACFTMKRLMLSFVYIPADTAGYRRLEGNMDTKKKMDMGQFAESIREKIEQQGRFGNVSLRNVLKNNGVTRCGLLLHSDGNNLAPAIYLEPFFEAYRNGADMEWIVGKILEIYESAPNKGVDMSFFREFPMVKDRLCMKLVNREANLEFLSGVPHREFLDMAVVYYVDCYNPGIEAGIIQVRNPHMGMWGVTEEDLWEAASKNTTERKPGRIESMNDILAQMFAGLKNADSECGSCMENGPMSMLIITNTERMYGAAAVLYSGMLKQAADKAGSDLFILPSSLHEVLAVPVTEGRDVDELRKIVMEVNQTELLPEDVLSDNVYIYRREQDRLEIA